MWEKINRYYPAWLELIPVLMLGFVWFYTAAHYAALPDQMPTHFGLSGQPDDWSTKGLGSVYLPLIILTAVWIGMALMNYFFIIKPDDPGKYINISKQQKEKLGPKQVEAIRITTARGMIVVNLTMVAMIATIQYGSINTALGLQKGLGWSVNIFGIALLIEAIGLSIKTVGMTFTTKTHR